MERLCTILVLSTLLIACTHSISTKEAEEADNWFKNLSQRKEKLIKLHFYVHDKLSGPNATVWEVARAEITSRSPTSFGQIRVLDDLITAEPDRGSRILGRAQGLITSADLDQTALAMNLNLVFTTGRFKGSTLCIAGRNPVGLVSRELPVVSGSGLFRMARGFSISNTYSYDPVEDYGVLEYMLYVSYV